MRLSVFAGMWLAADTLACRAEQRVPAKHGVAFTTPQPPAHVRLARDVSSLAAAATSRKGGGGGKASEVGEANVRVAVVTPQPSAFVRLAGNASSSAAAAASGDGGEGGKASEVREDAAGAPTADDAQAARVPTATAEAGAAVSYSNASVLALETAAPAAVAAPCGDASVPAAEAAAPGAVQGAVAPTAALVSVDSDEGGSGATASANVSVDRTTRWRSPLPAAARLVVDDRRDGGASAAAVAEAKVENTTAMSLPLQPPAPAQEPSPLPSSLAEAVRQSSLERHAAAGGEAVGNGSGLGGLVLLGFLLLGMTALVVLCLCGCCCGSRERASQDPVREVRERGGVLEVRPDCSARLRVLPGRSH